MKTRNTCLALVCGLWASSSLVQAQNTHYSPGLEGIKGASLPPPGIYLRDYNYFYASSTMNTPMAGPQDLFVYVQAPRLIWISDFKILGAYYGADIIVPFPYQDIKFNSGSSSKFGLGDISVEPITLSWHPKQFDISLGYAFWAPSGEYHSDSLSPGKGFWGQMITAGATWYVDQEKTWAVSALNRYEFNMQNSDENIPSTQYWTLEWGISKALKKTIDVGLIGYYQLKTTPSENRDYVVGVGPEVNMVCTKTGIIASLRYGYEVEAHNRPLGHTINLTLTKRF
jgi:hypothetical protein